MQRRHIPAVASCLSEVTMVAQTHVWPRCETRRDFLRNAGVSAGLAIASPALLRCTRAKWPKGNPFTLGVASGAPMPDGFVLWTRLAPDPLCTNPESPGGMTGGPVAL